MIEDHWHFAQEVFNLKSGHKVCVRDEFPRPHIINKWGGEMDTADENGDQGSNLGRVYLHFISR